MVRRRHGTLPDPADVKKRLGSIGWKHLKLDKAKHTVFLDRKGMSITLGGIAKGYAVDKCVAILQKQGFTRVANLPGGLKTWQQAGLPVEK